jgi:hypothetical protein
MNHYLEKSYQDLFTGSARISSSAAGVVEIISPITGIIDEIILFVTSPSGGVSIWNVRVAGVAIWAGGTRPSIVAPALTVTKTGVATAVTKGQIIRLDLEDPGTFGVVLPITMVVKVITPESGFSGTSATSFSVTTGSKAFTTQADLSLTVGSRIRAASSASPTANYMEGVITAYSGTTLTVTIDKAVGSGTHTDWLINLAGDPGSSGATGVLDDLTDVNAPSPSDQDVLTYDSGSGLWIPQAAPGGGGGGGGLYSPDYAYASPGSFDDEFDAGSLDAKWTNQGSAVVSFNIPNHVSIKPGASLSALTQSASGDRTFRMKLRFPPVAAASLAMGFLLRDSGSFFQTYIFDATNGNFSYDRWTGPTTFFSQGIIGTKAAFSQTGDSPIYLELKYIDSTKTSYFSISRDGVVWHLISSNGTVAGGAMDKIGIAIYGTAGSTEFTYIDWFRELQGVYTGGNS